MQIGWDLQIQMLFINSSGAVSRRDDYRSIVFHLLSTPSFFLLPPKKETKKVSCRQVFVTDRSKMDDAVGWLNINNGDGLTAWENLDGRLLSRTSTGCVVVAFTAIQKSFVWWTASKRNSLASTNYYTALNCLWILHKRKKE